MHLNNFDAGIYEENSSNGQGLVIRNNFGNFMAAKATTIPRSIEPHIAELFAVREGLLLAWNLGIRSIHIEGFSECYS